MSNAQILGTAPAPDEKAQRNEASALWEKSVRPAVAESLPGASDRTAATALWHRSADIRQAQFVVPEIPVLPPALPGRIPEPLVNDAARSLTEGADRIGRALARVGQSLDPSPLATAMVHAVTARPHSPEADHPTAPPIAPTSPANTVQLGEQARAQTKTRSETSCPAGPEELGLPVKSGRNQGDLPPALTTSTQTARRNAWAKDPTLQASGLAMFGPARNAPPPDDCATWQAHHLISVAQAQDPRNRKVLDPAIKAGWSLDEPANLIGLPQGRDAQLMLHRTGLPDADRPLHDNAHQRDYKSAVERGIAQVRDTLQETAISKTSPEYNQLARRLLEEEQAGLEKLVLRQGMTRLTEADRPHSIQEASAANTLQQPAAIPAVATSMHAPGDGDASARAVWFQSVGVSPTGLASTEPAVTRSREPRLG